MTLMISIDEDIVPSEGIEGVARIVSDMTDEAKALLDRWWEKNSARRDQAALARFSASRSAACTVFATNFAMVIGPTPPGTGVI